MRKYPCCPGPTWVKAADFGHAEGIDFTLGRCDVCSRYWMHLWTPYAPDAGYVALDDATAGELVTIPAGPDRRRRLQELFDV
ncbi:MAG: hypothetical protein HY322_15895 [Betaproteobacteria bacterium]|nr:hypothetical protein [Betaproteobacteria bacterium]